MNAYRETKHEIHAESTSCRLLITEDDAALRQMLSWEFEELGYRVIEAANCDEAERAAASQAPHVALLDFNLPDGSGTNLLQTLHKLYPDLLVVIYSGRACGVMAADAQRCGASRFLCKPVTAARLHSIFSELLAYPPENQN